MSSRNAATSAASASLNSVQLMLTRNPLDFASRMASTALSYVPRWHTDLSCIARLPSRWIDQVNEGCGW